MAIKNVLYIFEKEKFLIWPLGGFCSNTQCKLSVTYLSHDLDGTTANQSKGDERM